MDDRSLTQYWGHPDGAFFAAAKEHIFRNELKEFKALLDVHPHLARLRDDSPSTKGWLLLHWILYFNKRSTHQFLPAILEWMPLLPEQTLVAEHWAERLNFMLFDDALLAAQNAPRFSADCVPLLVDCGVTVRERNYPITGPFWAEAAHLAPCQPPSSVSVQDEWKARVHLREYYHRRLRCRAKRKAAATALYVCVWSLGIPRDVARWMIETSEVFGASRTYLDWD